MMPQFPTLDQPAAAVSNALASQLAGNRYLGKFRTISAPEVTGIVEQVLEKYTRWVDGHQDEVTGCCDYLRGVCSTRAIPLMETAYALYVLRDGLLENVPYGTRENVTQFFDLLVPKLMRLQ